MNKLESLAMKFDQERFSFAEEFNKPRIETVPDNMFSNVFAESTKVPEIPKAPNMPRFPRWF